jgi:hypothetical protein
MTDARRAQSAAGVKAVAAATASGSFFSDDSEDLAVVLGTTVFS